MSDEPGLFDTDGDIFDGAVFDGGPRARRFDPDTSHEAAASVAPVLRKLQRLVLEFAAMREPVGFTDVDLNAHFQTHLSTYRTRRRELADMGLLYDTGERRELPDAARRCRHAVWRITDKGQAQVAPLSRAA